MNWSSVFQFLITDVPFEALIWMLLAFSVFITFRIMNIADMSVDSLFAFAGIISLYFTKNLNVDPLVSVLIAVVISMGVGAINAALHIYLKIPALLAGIIVMVALYTPNVILSKGSIYSEKTMFTIANGLFSNMAVTKIVLLALIVAIVFILAYWFFGTEYGLSLRAAGKNSHMANANGINTNSRYFAGLILASAIAGLSGALYAHANRHISSDEGKGAIVIGLSIIFIGEVIFSSKSFKLSLVSLVIGGLIYWLIYDIILEIPGFNTNYLNLLKAVFIVVIVSIGMLKKYLEKRHRFKKAESEKKDEVTL